MTDLNKQVSKKHKLNKFLISKVLIYFILITGSLIMIAPFIWMITTSLKDEGAVFVFPPEFIPRAQIMTSHNNLEYGVFDAIINGKKEKVIKLKTIKDKVDVKLYKDGKVGDDVIKVTDSYFKPFKAQEKMVYDDKEYGLYTLMIKGKMKKPETIYMKFKKPFKVYMKWIKNPHKGRELIYVRGRNNDKLKVHIGGFLNLFLPAINLSPDATLDVTLYLEAENSLLATVYNIDTLEPIFTATTTLYNIGLGYDATQYTNEKGQTYFVLPETAIYDLDIFAPGYLATSTTINISGDIIKAVGLKRVE